MADLLLGLGAAVVKAACKLWLKDHEFAADASAGIVDVIKGRLTGELDRRNVRRLFEDLEAPVAGKISVLRRHEFSRVPDNEWTAAVLAVGDTLRRARFTDADVFADDLDPLYLRRRILAGAPNATRDLSAAGASLYDRLLTECCAYILELSSTLPRFNAGAFAEILHRQSVILQQVNTVLSRMPSPDEPRTGETRAEADFAAAYRRQVVNRLDRLELFGVTLTESLRGYPLSTAYISLAVASEGPTLRTDYMRLAVGGATRGGETGSGALRIEDAIGGTSRVFLRGEAGSGKTTLLQWLAVQTARPSAYMVLRLLLSSRTVPFLIRLRHYAGRELPGPEGFLGQVGQHIADEMPYGWVHRLLAQGQALVLVDGVDELPRAQRRAAREWLAALVEAFPDSRYVVTSRPGAVGSDWLNHEGFVAVDLQPMAPPDVREFVRHWHAALSARSVDAEQRQHLSSCEKALLDALNTRRHLRLLATSPLLCALTCALHLDRRMQLPEERMELYAVALDMLLERRDIERQIPGTRPPLSKTSKTLLLEDLAYWLIRNGWSDAPKDRAIQRITQRLATMPQLTADGAAILDDLIERSGLIREPVAGRIDFVHRTFEEYLAAHAAINGDQVGELVRNAHGDQWREVVVLAAGHAQPRQRDELLNGLLAHAETEPGKRQVLQALAVACLETSPELDPALDTRIRQAAEALLPPRTIRQAEVLAKIGEPLLDLLADRPPRTARQAVATIRAASLVGGDAALHLIAAIAADPNDAVGEAVLRAWPLFDAEEYARVVLAGSPHGSMVRIDDPSQLPALRHLPDLGALTINSANGCGDLAIIRDLPQLMWLSIRGDPQLTDLSPLAYHPALQAVILDSGIRADLGPLATIPKLSRLHVWADAVTNIQALRGCVGLENVRLTRIPVAMSLTGVLPPHPLKALGLTEVELEDLLPLLRVPQLAKLKDLMFIGCARLRSLDGIETWAETLRVFTLWNLDAVEDLSPLTQLPRLECLYLAWHATRHLPIARELPTLRRLYLYSDHVTDLTPLQGVVHLTVHVGRRQKILHAELLGEGSKIVRD